MRLLNKKEGAGQAVRRILSHRQPDLLRGVAVAAGIYTAF